MKRFLIVVFSILLSSQAQCGEKYALLVAVKEYEHSEMINHRSVILKSMQRRYVIY